MQEQKPALDVRRQARKAALKSLIIPVGVVLFFVLAPRWLDHRLHTSAAADLTSHYSGSPEQLQERLDRLNRLDFAAAALDDSPEHAKLHARLVESGLTSRFEHLHWAELASFWLLIAILLTLGTIYLLNRGARQSSAALIRNYRLAWEASMITSFIIVLLLTPLMTFACFELTILLMDAYIPKLLILIAIMGLIALGAAIKILFKSVPLVFQEPFARAVTPEEAPRLWQAVREAASRLQTEPPDQILLGMQLNFYVTELAVIHEAGRAEGRTLYLSLPLLKQMPANEVTAIIGHELGHFLGQDTAMTRKFFPLRYKIGHTLTAMAKSGWVSWPSAQLLNFFHWCFGETEQAASREREFLADQRGAELTSSRIAAQALIRFQVMMEAFQRNMETALKSKDLNPLQMPLTPVIQQQLAGEAAFWGKLFEKSLPHPLDSHPPLRARLESLGQPLDGETARAIALESDRPAYEEWLTGTDALLSEVTRKAEAAVDQMREQSQVKTADVSTEEGRELLKQHFPEQVWIGSNRGSVAVYIIGGIALFFLGMIALISQDAPTRWWTGGLAVALFVGLVLYGRKKRELRMVLNAEGVKTASMIRPVPFAEVSNVVLHNHYSIYSLAFTFKKAQPPFLPSRWANWNRKSYNLPLNGYGQKPQVIAQTIFNYLTRQQPADKAKLAAE